MTATTPGRWSDPDWLDDALGWADRALEGAGLRRTAWTMPHNRPWSAVARIETTDGVVWLKANGDGTRHEAALLAALADLGIARTPRPLATDAGRGLSLLPDGGPTVRATYDGSTPPAVLEPVLQRYAELQRATEPHVGTLVDLGVDDVRPGRMTWLFETLVDETAGAEGTHRLTAVEAAQLRDLLPAYSRACAELDSAGIPAALQHDDLHDNNVLDSGPVFIDWGDAVVGHPFGTMLTTLGSVAHHQGLARDDPALDRLVDAYTEPWTDLADRQSLRHQVELAVRVGPLTRALAWRRALVGCDAPSWDEWGDGVHGWLLEVLSPDLPLHPPLLA